MNNTYITNATTNSIMTSGATGYNGTWAVNNTTISTDPVLTINGDKTSLDVKGKLIINGLDLEERLNVIEKVLMIPERDATMEARYPSLKKKFDEYINTLEKYRTFERIRGTEND
jgi:hypothetical protein